MDTTHARPDPVAFSDPYRDNPSLRSAHLLDRLQQDAQVLARYATQAATHREPYRLMRRVAQDLERVAVPLILAAEHCNHMLDEPVIEDDIALLRDTTHLCARIEAMVSQLEDTVRTLERLIERPMPVGDERAEQPDRPSLPRAARPAASGAAAEGLDLPARPHL